MTHVLLTILEWAAESKIYYLPVLIDTNNIVSPLN